MNWDDVAAKPASAASWDAVAEPVNGSSSAVLDIIKSVGTGMWDAIPSGGKDSRKKAMERANQAAEDSIAAQARSGTMAEINRQDENAKQLKAAQENAGSLVGDVGADLLSGTLKTPGAFATLADLPLALTVGATPVRDAAKYWGEKTGIEPGKWADAIDKSPATYSQETGAQKETVNRAWKDSGGEDLSLQLFDFAFGGKATASDLKDAWTNADLSYIAKAYKENPRASLSTVMQSAPSMLAGGVISRGLMGLAERAGVKLSAEVAGGIGEGAITAGQNTDQMLDHGVDPQRAALAGIVSGSATGTIGAASGKLATKLGLPDVNTVMAGGGKEARKLPLWHSLQTSMVQEGLLEELPQSMHEQVWQNWAEKKPLGEGVLRSGAEGAIAGAAMAGGVHPFTTHDESANLGAPAPADTGAVNAADVLGAAPADEPQPQPGGTPQDNLQNRDRTREASIIQMQKIAQKPDYELASIARDQNGAPMVEDNKAIPEAQVGRAERVTLPDGTKIDTHYAVVEADTLSPSHFADGRENPDYGAEGKLTALNNGRTAGLMESYRRGTAANYRAALEADSAGHGIPAASIAGMKAPVLVRVYDPATVNQTNLGARTNQATALGLSPSEQASTDAARITYMDDLNPTETGDFATSRDFVQRFVGALPITEQAGMMDKDGQLSQAGYARIRNAILAKAYGNSPALLRMTESMDDSLRNISKALMQVAPSVAKSRDGIAQGALHHVDITDVLLPAVDSLNRLRESGVSVAEHVAQQGMFSNARPEVADMLRFLDENVRRPRKVADFLNAYLAALDAAGNPGQGTLLGGSTAPTQADLMAAARRSTNDDQFAATAEAPRFSRSEGRGSSPGADSKGQSQPGNAQGNLRGAGEGAQPAVNDEQEIEDAWQAKTGAITPLFSRGAALQSDNGLPSESSVNRILDAGTLRDLRREAAGLESPERGTFLTVTEDGRAVATGQPGTRVPETFTRFAEKHGLTFDARRIAPGQRGGSQGVGAPLGVASMDSAGREMSDKSPPMPIEYRESGAMYFGEMGSFIDRTGKTRFSRSTPLNGGISTENVEREAKKLLAGLANPPKLSVVWSPKDLPFDAPDDARGVFFKGTMYLVAGGITSAENLREVVAHEMIGHYGLRGFFGSALDAVLARIHNINPLVQKNAKEWIDNNQDLIAEYRKKGMTEAQIKSISIEEGMAKIAEAGKVLTGAKLLAVALQRLLRAVGLHRLANALEAKTDAEALLALKKAEMFVKRAWTTDNFIKQALFPLFRTAYHGTPHEVDRFSTEYIGDGEGAQAYGWGLYFSESREVAQWWRNRIAAHYGIGAMRATKDGKELVGRDILGEYFKPGREIKGYDGIDKVISFTPERYGDNYRPWSVTVQMIQDQFGNKPKSWDAKPRNHATEPSAKEVQKVLEGDGWQVNRGRLYQVELAPTVDEYLDWDKPLAKQSNTVKAALEAAFPGDWNDIKRQGGDWRNLTGEQFYRNLSESMAKDIDETVQGGWGLVANTINDRNANDRAASERLHSVGIRGIRYRDGAAINRSAGEPQYNYVIFSDDDISDPIALSRIRGSNDRSKWRDSASAFSRINTSATTGIRHSQTANERADAIINSKVAVFAPIDKTLQVVSNVTGATKLASWTGGKIGQLLDRLTPETIKAGIVADYGIPEAVIDRRAQLAGAQREQVRKTGELIDKLMMLTRAESRVAYLWMNSADPQSAEYFRDQLPPESIKTLAEVEKMIDSLSAEAVRLGQMSAETRERNRFAYLHRSYAKHMEELTKGEKSARQRAIAVLGNQYKGRGMTDERGMSSIKNIAPEWWNRKTQSGKADKSLKGEKFIRLERRQAIGQGVASIPGIAAGGPKAKLLEVHYWPAGEALPAKYGAWDQAGTWEARDIKGDKLILWRDFTAQEREAMGEIDEVRYAIAKTLHGMIHDVEVGKYLEWVAVKHAAKDKSNVTGPIIEASESMRDAFKPGTWVQVPETRAFSGGPLKYGLLAGRYLPGPIWNDVRQTAGMQFKPLGDLYSKLLTAWKTSKTALSPAVHTNNVMSNFVMADWHDVSSGHVFKALRILLAASTGDGQGVLGRIGNVAGRVVGSNDVEAAKVILARFEDSGGSIGTWATKELRADQLEPLVEALEKELGLAGNVTGDAGVYAALQQALHLKFPAAWDALKRSTPGRLSRQEAKNMLALYEAEDQVFRLGAWLKGKEDGATDTEAGKFGRESFLDYHINAPWVQAMRSTMFPFISYTYRALPMLAQTAKTKPWKFAKLALIAGALNAIGYAMSGGDEEKERAMLPEEKAGRVWGLVPKLMRMPWNDSHSSPVFLDVRRWIPAGDVFDVGQAHSVVPVLPFMIPGGPLAMLFEFSNNKSGFTGQAITEATDTPIEKALKLTDWAYKSFMPNLVFVPGTYAWQGISDAASGKTDSFGRQMSLTQSAANSVGVKLGSYPGDVLRLNAARATKAKMQEIDHNITLLSRQFAQHGITKEQFESKVAAEIAKKQGVVQDFQKRAAGR